MRYVDAPRDCAVEIGETDIRREIMRHRGKYKQLFLSQNVIKHIFRWKNSMLADEADNPGFLLLLEQAEREVKAGRPEIASTYLDK